MLATALIYVPWLVFFFTIPASAYVFAKWNPQKNIAFLWAALCIIIIAQGENLLLGPLARPEFGDGERHFHGYFPLLAQDDSLFLSSLGAGVDRFAFTRIGAEYFSLRRLLAGALPLWAVLAFFRLIVPIIAFVGVWLFGTRLLAAPPKIAVATGIIYATSFDFTTSLTFLHGFSLAAFPLILFLLFYLRASIFGFFILALAIIAYIIASEPFYWLPVFIITTFCVILFIRPKSWWILIGGVILLAISWVLNYAEVIYAFIAFLPISARTLHGVGESGDFLTAAVAPLLWMAELNINLNRGSLAFTIPLLVGLSLAIWSRSLRWLFACLVSIALVLFSSLMWQVPWSQLGLGFLSTYRWYTEYASNGVVLLAVAGAAGAALANEGASRLINGAAAILLAVGLSHLAYFKLQQIGHLAVRGNLTHSLQVSELSPGQRGIEAGFRTISIPSRIDANFAANGGLETYEVGATLLHRGHYEFWQKGIHKYFGVTSTSRSGLGDHPAFNQCCQPLQISTLVDLDMLRTANVRYILSYRQLFDEKLRQIAGPQRQVEASFLTQLLDPAPPVFIYEIADPLPRAFPVYRVEVVDDDASAEVVLKLLRANQVGAITVVRRSDAERIIVRGVSTPNVRAYPVRDGYEIIVGPHSGTSIVVNVPYFPWWEATAEDGLRLDVAEASLIHTVVPVPAGTQKFRLIYKRPLLMRGAS